MKIKQVLLGLSLFITAAGFSQTAKKEVLFTIDGKPYYTDEFVRVYNKNLDLVKDDSQKDINNYLDLFVGYKLKINKANKLGLNNDKEYQDELKSYRNQLSKNYVTDSKVTKELVEEAYNRSLKEVRASHILFMADENAAPADTLKAYNKAMDVRKKALAGEDFGKLAQQYSEDPSAKDNKGDLGYFSVFKMVYPFESGAFNTQKGNISKPVRSRFGYHLIRVNDVRDNRGEVTVAHIMIMKPKTENAEEAAKARKTINEISQKLKQGEDFTALAKQFSQDKSTAVNGGQLNKFGSGELSSEEFENAAFALKTPGQVSEPVETGFGWHIIKLIEKHQPKPLNDVQADLENKIKRDERSKLISQSLTDKLRKRYTVKKDAKAYTAAVKTLNDKIYSKSWELPKDVNNYTQTVLTINNDKKIPVKSFLEYVDMSQRGSLAVKPVAKQAGVLFERFTDEQLNTYYNDNLEKEYPEFDNIMEEYRDGLLLFDLMEKEIWEKAKNDSIGLNQYYTSHTADYQWKDRADAQVYSSTKQDVIKKTRKYLKKGKNAAYIKEKLNTDGKVEVVEKQGVFEKDNDALPAGFNWKTGVSDIIKDGDYYYVVKADKIMPKGPKTLEENKGRVINDYQQYLESKWVNDLKQEFKVVVNNEALQHVKQQLNK